MQYDEEFLFCNLIFMSRYLYCQDLLTFAKDCMTTVFEAEMTIILF